MQLVDASKKQYPQKRVFVTLERVPKRGLSANWRTEIRNRWGIRILGVDPSPLAPLWSTRCALTKGVKRGRPHELYKSPLLTKFFALVRDASLRFGVLSDLYGLHMDIEELEPYDVHPSTLTPQTKVRLGLLIADKARSNGFEEVIFYNSSPLRSVPYFEMLAASGLSVWYTTRLIEL